MKTPLLLQMHATECGAACLGSILAFFGRWVPLTELRARCEISRDGSTAAGIVRAAGHYGIESQGRNVRLRHLNDLPLPIVLFWHFNHFLILEGFDGSHYYLNDPATGRRKLSKEEFSKGFTGIALTFKPGPDFRTGGIRPSIAQRFPGWIRGNGQGLAYAVACGLMLALLALVGAGSLTVMVDQVLAANQPWGMLMVLVLSATAALAYALTLLKHRILRRLAVRISTIASDHCVARLLRLPIAFFSQRLVGDLVARILSIDKIAKGVAEHFLGLLIEIAMSLLFIAAMLWQDASLALIVVALAAMNAATARIIARARVDESHAVRREKGLLMGIGTQMLDQNQHLRMMAADDRSFARWGGHQARELAARQRFVELSHVNSVMPYLFTALAHAAVLAIGGARVMEGELTLGALAGFYLIAGMFLAPVGRFAGFADEQQALETSMQRLDDITNTPVDSGLARRRASTGIATLNGKLRLAGAVELRKVTFGYNLARAPLIKDFSLKIEAGQRVAIVGPSGSCKSTIARLVAGLYQPWSGEILFDGHAREEIPEQVLSRSLSVIDQHVALFPGTVRDNITLWSAAVPDSDLMAAARDACIHDEILARPLGYATPVEENGANFSGGERQRMEIARALARKPTVLILDEATSALDAATEESVDRALRRRGMTCLMVAHRLSTIRDCDEIIVMDKGAEAQRGTHEELMLDKEGIYRRLVRSD